jgi:hypothetical protein
VQFAWLLVFFAALAAYLFVVWWSRRQAFRRAGEVLRLTSFVQSGSTFSGDRDGVHLHFEHSGGKRARSRGRSRVTVLFAPCELLFSLRRETDIRRPEVARGFELTTGDEAFDELWIIEGAPAARVLRVLDNRRLRERLTRFALTPGAEITIEDGNLTMDRIGSEYTGGEVIPDRLELAIDLALAVVEESSRAPEAGEVVEQGSDYRNAPRVQDDGPAKVAELSAHHKVRALRGQLAGASVLGPLVCLWLTHFQGLSQPMSGALGAAAEGLVTAVVLRVFFAARRLARDASLGVLVWVWVAACWAFLAFLALAP